MKTLDPDSTVFDLGTIDLPDGWSRREIAGGERMVIESRDPAGELVLPLDVVGPHMLRIDFFTRAHARNASMQLRLSSQKTWRRVRPLRFIYDDADAIQPADVVTLDVKEGDALHLRVEPVSYIALAGISLTPATIATPPAGEKQVGFVHDTNMSLSKFRTEEPDDVYAILEPYVDSHVTHIFFGTGVGTYSPLYHSDLFGWHAQEQRAFMAWHRELTAKGIRMLAERGKDLLAMAVEYAHANGLQLWANHRISKNHEHDFRDDYPGGRFLIEHRDKLVREVDGSVHGQTIMSHAYPEIRKATVEMLVEQARYGVDGLYVDFSRKSPIVGWEEKSIEDFAEKHGFDPREKKPEGFARMWFDHLCTYPTLLFRELRAALASVERELGRHMPVAAYVAGGWRWSESSPGCINAGLDPYTWAHEGLVDIVIPGRNLWIEQQCLDRYMHDLAETDCDVWGAIGPQDQALHRSMADRKKLGEEYADTDPWRYLQAAHDFYSQGVSGVALWEAQDIPSVPQVWNTIRHRIGSHFELCKTFGDKLGRYDGSDKYERQLI